MADRWALAFGIPVLLVLVGGAIRSGPRDRRRGTGRARVFRRFGGVLLAASAVAGWAAAPDISGRLVAAGVAAIALALAGTLDEHGRLPRRATFIAELIAAVAVVGAGLRVGVMGPDLIDGAVTVVWLVSVTTAWNGLADPDGLAAGVTLGAAGGVFALAGFGNQDALAAIAAATAGACLGFLAYNLPPASLVADRGATLFLGFVIAVATVEARPAIGAPGSLTVPLMLASVALLDAVFVAFARLRHRKQLTTRRPDHVAHHLEARGWTIGATVATLVALQLAASALAVFVARGVLAPAVGAGVVAVLLLALAVAASRGRIYRGRPEGLRPVWKLALLGLVVAGGAAAIPATLAGIQAREMLLDGRDAARDAVNAARRGEPREAARHFTDAADLFEDARDRLGGPLVSAGLVVPVLASNLEATRDLAAAGADLARAGVDLTAPVDPEKLRVRDGRVDLAEVRRIAPSLETASAVLTETERRVGEIDSPFLLGPVKDAIAEVERELGRTELDAARGAEAARLLPDILGGDGPRRYFLAVQNTAELRATGGAILHWGILTAVDGEVDLESFDPIRLLNPDEANPGLDRTLDAPDEYVERYGRFEPAQTWQNVNMSPDFPVVGRVIAGLYPQSGGQPIDGVIAVDPYGLAALLQLTGPIDVPPWPVPITSKNVVEVTLREAYAAFEGQEAVREDFLGDVAEVAIDEATEGDLGRPDKIARALGEASREGHADLYFTRPEEQALAEVLGADAAVPAAAGDSLLLVAQNAGANKLDLYVQRALRYDVRVEPDPAGTTARVRGQLEVQLANTATLDLPRIVIGPNIPELGAGQHRMFVSIYSPLAFTAATLNGFPIGLESDAELGRNVFSGFVDVGAGENATLVLELDGAVALAGGDYVLDLLHQPSAGSESVDVRVELGPGWRVAGTDGLDRQTPGRARGRVELEEGRTVRVELDRGGGRDLWDRLHHGP